MISDYEIIKAQEQLLFDIGELMANTMKEEGITQNTLAGRFGRHRSFVSRILKGDSNISLRTLATVMHVLGYQLRIRKVKDGG